MEDDIRDEALANIAGGQLTARQAQQLAEIVRQTAAIKFQRHTA